MGCVRGPQQPGTRTFVLRCRRGAALLLHVFVRPSGGSTPFSVCDRGFCRQMGLCLFLGGMILSAGETEPVSFHILLLRDP